ncbi:MAG: hypothetical protein II973_10385 [Spirochaetaceae bacterium]|nr:hypothetical protein [Spirochaetaceae bacterium]
MTAVKGIVHGNTVVIKDENFNIYDGCEVEVRIPDKKPMTYNEACDALMKLEGSGIWEGNLNEMREARCQEW